ncbi:MAG TPA: response regulator [Candidatus Acidoferrales bacterium]|nr:response regulator [Candidatus Acidoferrales bacterium]
MPRVLVADDNTNIQRMVALAFQDRGIDVISVGHGEAAVRRLPDLNPDLILADIFMPVRNGYELCEWVKKNPKYSHIPVILLVGAFDPLDEKEARRVGADGILKKPFIPPDPLIAMVTAMLLKNPAIAEELARGKKEAAAPPPPPPAAVLEIPARTAPKPLPEFPEPSPEEAELAYSFGTGRRAPDNLDNEEEKSDEHPAPKEVDEEEFDGTSTVNDWRRSAMKFEVSEEAAMRPAISSDENFDQVSPGERELSCTNVHVLDTPEPVEPLVQDERDNETAEPPVSEATEPALQAIPAESAQEPEPAPEPAMPVAQPAEPKLQEACETELDEIIPEPSFASKATHWMDMMSSTPGRPAGDWFSSVLSPVEAVVRQEPTEAPAFTDPLHGEPSHAEPLPDEVAPAEVAYAAAPTVEEPVAEPVFEPEMEAQAVPVETMAAPTDEEDSFFADEPAEPEPATSAPCLAVAPVSEPSSFEPLPQLEDEPLEAPVSEHAVESASKAASDHAKQAIEDETPEPMTRASSAFDSGFFVEEAVPESSYKEPGLVEPPAVRVVPEPLLVDEVTQTETSIYNKHADAMPALDSFTLPSQEEPPAEEPAWEEVPVRSESGNGSREFASREYSEWTPTVAPPTREALADIPFLNPPADFHRDAPSTDNDGPDKINSETVDAIVQRLLEKIEPQLHDILSQGVLKPLVQSFLHSELEKKEK